YAELLLLTSFPTRRSSDLALQRAAQLMVEIAGGEVATAVNDVYPTAIQPKQITFRWDKAFTLIGKKLEKDAVKNILRDLEIEIRSEEHTSELQSRENLVCR